MATQTIYPNEDFSNNWTLRSLSSAWEEISEVGAHDGLGSFVNSKNPGEMFQVGFDDPTPIGVINSVTYNFVINAVGKDSELEIIGETANGIFTIQSALAIIQDSSFHTYSYVYTEDPNSPGIPFDYIKLNDSKVQCTAAGNDGVMIITQIYITIDYTEATPKTVAMIIG